MNEIGAVDGDREYRWRWALRFIGRPAIAALAHKATDTTLSSVLRAMALRTICCEFYKDHGAATGPLQSLLESEPGIRCWAAVILAKAGLPIHSHDAFLAALASDDDKLVEEAIYSLHSFKSRSAEEQEKVKAAILPCLTHPVRGNCCMFPILDLNERDLPATGQGIRLL